MKFPSIILALVLFQWCTILPASAQPQEQVQVQFVSFPIIQNAHPVELWVGPEKAIEVELPSRAVSKVYTVNRQNLWALGKSSLGPDQKPIFKTFGKAPATASSKQLILVICKGANYEDGLELIALDANQKDFAGGKYLMYNATKVDIAGSLGEDKFMIKPGHHIMMAPKPNEVKRDKKYLHAYLYFRKGGEAQPFYSSTWRYNETVRCFTFIYHDPENQRLKTHSIRDYLP